MIIPHLEFHIFIVVPTFHDSSIDNHNLEFGHKVDISMGVFSHSLVDRDMSAMLDQEVKFCKSCMYEITI
jgi:hypothetical protein